MRPLADGVRAVGIEARKVAMRDILLALRIKEDDIDADLPLSASIRAEIAADGTPRVVQGQVLVGSGTISDRDDGKRVSRSIDHADIRFMWDARPPHLGRAVPGAGRRQPVHLARYGRGAERRQRPLADRRHPRRPVIDPVIIAAPAQSNERGHRAQSRHRPGAHRYRAQAHRSRSGRHRPHRHAADATMSASR